jgi:hypothetical protein
MSGANIVRVFVGVLGVVLLASGLALALSFFGSGGVVIGFWLVLGGLVLIVGVAIERTRYRSQTAEELQLPPGPGGGEPTRPEARFQPTDEVFVDPTTNRRMRVFLDANTGERRYVAEG